MTKQRASLRGRGAEILFGEPEPVEIEPRSSESTPTEAEPEVETPGEEQAAQDQDTDAGSVEYSTEPELFLDDPELERALEEEALAGVSAEEEEPVAEPEMPPEPDRPESGEMAYGLETATEDTPSTGWRKVPVSTEELATAEVVAGEAVELGPLDDEAPAEGPTEEVLYEPPPPEVDDLVRGVLPPRRESMDVQEPDEPVVPITLPERELTEEEKGQILTWLGEQQIHELESAIGEAYVQVRSTISDNEAISTECFNKLLQARDIVVHRDLGQIAQAEYNVEWVRTRLQRATNSDAAAKKSQWWILIWGLIWFSAFLALLILLNEGWFRDMIAVAGLSNTLVNMDVLLSTMIWGGIGGVVSVLYSLFKHVGQRDFDAHYSLSYVGKPFLGVILGATVYMVFNLLMRTLGILPAELSGIEDATAPAVAPGVMYLLAWFSGFKENRIFDILDRTMKRIFSGGESS
jgi:hypothetical protein